MSESRASNTLPLVVAPVLGDTFLLTLAVDIWSDQLVRPIRAAVKPLSTPRWAAAKAGEWNQGPRPGFARLGCHPDERAERAKAVNNRTARRRRGSRRRRA